VSSFIDDFTVIAVDISDISNFYDESSDRFVDGYWFYDYKRSYR
jgi:hypothetical protein